MELEHTNKSYSPIKFIKLTFMSISSNKSLAFIEELDRIPLCAGAQDCIILKSVFRRKPV